MSRGNRRLSRFAEVIAAVVKKIEAAHGAASDGE